MPIYVLGPRNPSVEIPNQALTVSISGSVREASLVIHTDDDQATMQPNSHLAVLPRVSGPISVTVVPADADRFAANTKISLAIGHDAAGDLDPVQVLFDPVDVSRDSSPELARLIARGASVEVSAAAGADIPLSPLASAARASARKVLGRQTHAAHGPVLVALDTSASMLPVFAGGSAAAAIDVVVGVAAAVGISDVSAVLVGEEPIPVSCGVAAQLAAEVGQAAPRWSAGARWSRLPDNGGCIVVCTDFPTRTVLQRSVVLAFSDARGLDAHCVRMPTPRPGLRSDDELLADSFTLDAITSSLVRAFQ
jgi:hypothetical protein